MKNKEYILQSLEASKNDIALFGVQSIGLFGSYSRDEQADSSDIDILLDFEPDKETFDNFIAVCDIIENLFQYERVDIVTKNGLSPYIGPKILQEVVYV